MDKDDEDVQILTLDDGEKMQYKRLSNGTYILAHERDNIHTNHLHIGFNNDGTHTIISHKVNDKHKYKYSGKSKNGGAEGTRYKLSELHKKITGKSNNFNTGWQPRNQLTNTQGATMSNLERYNDVLLGLQTAKVKITSNIQQLQSQLELYSRQIEAMQQAGLMDDYADKLRAYNGLELRIKKLQEFLYQIIRKLTEIESYIQQLKADANRTN